MPSLHNFSRTELLIGSEGLTRLRNAHCLVLGLGGVGSYAAEALARAGVGKMTLVDFDDICLTNINRQLHALDTTVGKTKVEIMAERLCHINPAADIVALKEFYSKENSQQLLSGGYEYVLDCIDHFTSKVHLLVSCREKGLPVISSMGAAAKLDPTKICVSDIAQTHACRMARSVRKLLRKQGVYSGIKTVYSIEPYHPPMQTDGGCREDCICPAREGQQFSCQHRKVILGSISYIPAIFGMTMAGVVVNSLLEKN